jgi:hypothetical protein
LSTAIIPCSALAIVPAFSLLKSYKCIAEKLIPSSQ